MNSKERVFAAIQGAPFDRRPFTATLCIYGAKLTNCELKEYFTNPAAFAAGQTAVKEILKPDILFSPFALASLAEAFGSKIRYFSKNPPNMVRPVISSTDEIQNLAVPDINSNPNFEYILESVSLTASSHGQETALVGIILSPVDIPMLIMGIDGWMQAVLFDKEGAKRMLDITIPFSIEYANKMLAGGAHALAMPAALLQPSVSTREIVEEFALPVLRETFAKINGPILIHHTGGAFIKNLDLMTGLPNVVGFVMDHTDNLTRAREIIGRGPTLLTGPDGPGMSKSTPEEIERRCVEILKDRKDDPNFILCTAGADIPFDTPVENIEAMRKAVESFGASA